MDINLVEEYSKLIEDFDPLTATDEKVKALLAFRYKLLVPVAEQLAAIEDLEEKIKASAGLKKGTYQVGLAKMVVGFRKKRTANEKAIEAHLLALNKNPDEFKKFDTANSELKVLLDDSHDRFFHIEPLGTRTVSFK